MKLGVIGVGHLAESLLMGLLRAEVDPAGIVLSPRGHGPELAQRHGFALATDNHALVDACDLVLLAVRPSSAAAALKGLPWRARHLVVSACAGVSIAVLEAEAAPARVARIMPITAAELGASPTAVYPMLRELAPLLEALGTAIPLTSEDQFEVATVSAAIYGWAQALIRRGAEWSAEHGLEPEIARQLMARTFVAAGRIQSEQDAPMEDILASLCTPGGITEAGLKHLTDHGVPEAWEGACDLVLCRLTSRE
ncbi:NAD(P)-binding domain-containing protein [Rhodobacteraceae bacterium NNCM2]|nr:NAD(P)-binding domain-containing protein [Coraliihabitans acroporae]